MEIKVTDQAIKIIGENVMNLVKEYRNAPSTGSKSSDIKDIVDDLDNAIKEARAGQFFRRYFSEMY